MRKVTVITGLGLLSLLMSPVIHNAQAQGGPPDGGDGPRFGDDGPSRQDGPGGPHRGPRTAQGQLGGLWHSIGHLDGSGAPISKAQAKRIVALIKPWASKPIMSEADAKKLDAQLKTILTTGQKTLIEKMRPKRGPGGPDGPGGPGGNDDRPGPPPPRADGGEPDGGGPGGGGPDDGGPGGGPGRDGKGPRGRGDFGPGGGPGGQDGGRGRGGQRPGGQHPGGPGGRRGPDDHGPGGRSPDDPMRKFNDSMNPFYAPTGYKQWKEMPDFAQKDIDRHYREGRATLEALSRKAKS